MKNVKKVILGVGLIVLAGCGEDRTVYQQAAPAAPAAVEAPLAPLVTKVDEKGFPEALIVYATVNKKSKLVTLGTLVTLDLKLQDIAFDLDSFNETLDLKGAKAVEFGSVHKKCKLTRGFGPLVQGEGDFELRGNFGICTNLFNNIVKFKNMHIRFTNVPLASDKNKVIPFVELRLAPPA